MQIVDIEYWAIEAPFSELVCFRYGCLTIAKYFQYKNCKLQFKKAKSRNGPDLVGLFC